MTTMLDEALDCALRGWYIFPCREKPGTPYKNKNDEWITPEEKTPYTSKGLHDATIDVDQIVSWFTTWPDAMIGVNAGLSGLFVVDIDRKHVDGLETYSKWNINDTAGLQSITPSGGQHIVFTGRGKSGSNAKTGIDTRGEGGYFIAPPSRIIQGEHPGEYKRFNDWGKTPGVIPDGLMANLFPDKVVEYVKGVSSGSNGEKKELSRASLNFLVNGAMPGERNSTLFKVMADFVGCGYTQEEAKEFVFPVCERIGIGVSEFEKVMSHAYSKPRTSSIPDSVQEKIKEGGKNLASRITPEEATAIEEALLACLLIDNNVIPPVSDIIGFEDFQVFKNRVIFKSIIKLNNSGMKVDYLTVSNEVNKETDKISLDDISKIVNGYYANTENVTTYALIIKEKSSIRQIEALMDNKASYMKSGSLVEIVANIEKSVADIALHGGVKSTSVINGSQAIDLITEHNRKMESGEIEQLKIGFADYDNQIGGLYSNELVLSTGKAGAGKSALALSILNNVGLTQGKPVAMFTLEMSTRETICRLVTQLTGIPFKNVYQAKMTVPQWKDYKTAIERIKDSKLFFDDSFGITVAELRAKIRRLMEKDIKLIVVDQLEQVQGHGNQPQYIQLDKISYEIKSLTKEFDTPIILNHQIRIRAGLDKNGRDNGAESELQDLNQAGEKAPDQVWMIQHRTDDSKNIIQSKIKMAKNRNGIKIDFPVKFLGERMLFANLSKQECERAVKEVKHDDNPNPDWARE